MRRLNLFNNLVITALKKQLDASSLRQRVSANNLANINTPGFKKSTVSFEEKLAAALKASAAHGPQSSRNAREAQTTHGVHSVGNGRKTQGAHHINNKNSQTSNEGVILNRVKPEVVCDRWTAIREDGNNVDLEEEMVVLVSNGFMYQTASQLISNKYNDLSYVIKGGR